MMKKARVFHILSHEGIQTLCGCPAHKVATVDDNPKEARNGVLCSRCDVIKGMKARKTQEK
jgi:hypothetical protein